MVANSIWNEILTVHKNQMWSSKVWKKFCILNSFNTKWVLILDILQVQFKNQSTIKFSSSNTQSCLLREFLLKFFKNFQHSIKNSNESSSHQFVRSEVHQTLLNFFKNSRKVHWHETIIFMLPKNWTRYDPGFFIFYLDLALVR